MINLIIVIISIIFFLNYGKWNFSIFFSNFKNYLKIQKYVFINVDSSIDTYK